MTEVNKEVAEAVWKAHDDGKSLLQIAALIRVSPTSVSRLIRSRKLFQTRIDGEIAPKIGWSVKRVAQVHNWCIDYHASHGPEEAPPPEHVETFLVAAPVRQKAKEAHLDDVRRLIEDWKGCFAVRSASGIWWAGPNPFTTIDGHPLFDQLPPHVGTKLWDSYRGFRRDNEAYLELVSQLRQSTQDKAPWGVDLPIVTAGNQMGIHETWGWAAFNLALDVAQDILPLNKLENAYSFAPSDSLGFPGTDLIGLFAGGYVVLAVPNGVEAYQDHHITFVRKLAGSAEAQDLVRRHSNLSKAAAAIQKDIDQLLFSRDYVLRRCTFAVCIDSQA